MDIKQTLSEQLNDLRLRIIENHIRAGQKASGRTIQSMQVVVEDMGDSVVGTLYGRQYFQNLETGNKPWKNPTTKVPRFFHDIIDQWISDKGLSLNAWAVAYKIIHEGTKLYRDGGRDDIYSNEIPKTLESIGDAVTALYDMQITEMINLNNKEI